MSGPPAGWACGAREIVLVLEETAATTRTLRGPRGARHAAGYPGTTLVRAPDVKS